MTVRSQARWTKIVGPSTSGVNRKNAAPKRGPYHVIGGLYFVSFMLSYPSKKGKSKMKAKQLFLSVVSFVLAILMLTSCSTTTTVSTGPGIGNGPPAHAPAWGHRKKEKATEVVVETRPSVGVKGTIEIDL